MDIDLLPRLAVEHRAMKPPAYCELYEQLFRQGRMNVGKVLEIGVLDGGSLAMWRDYFPNATIVGIDQNEPCKRHESGRVHVRIGKQANTTLLAQVCLEFGPFDIIIDDGSHRWDDQRITFEFFWTHPWHFYAIEDLQTSYVDPGWPAQLPDTKPFVDVLNERIGRMHRWRLDKRYPTYCEEQAVKRVTTIAGLSVLEKVR